MFEPSTRSRSGSTSSSTSSFLSLAGTVPDSTQVSFSAPTLPEWARATAAGITESGSQEVEELLRSDLFLPSSPKLLVTPPLSPQTSLLSSPPPSSVISDLTEPEYGWEKTDAARTVLLELGMVDTIRITLSKEERLDLALVAIKSGYFLVNAAAYRYGVSETTLRRRLNGGLPKKITYISQQLLTIEEEHTLKEYILHMCDLGRPPTLLMISGSAQAIGKGREARKRGVSSSEVNFVVGKNWPRRFVKRHMDLVFKLSSALESKRALQGTPAVCCAFIQKLKETVEEYKILPEDVWNMDEKGCAKGGSIGKATKAVFSANSRQTTMTSSDRRWVSFIEFVSATGVCGGPFIIHDGQGQQVSRNLATACRRQFGKDVWGCAVSPNGWSDNYIALQWLEKVFLPFTNKRRKGKYTLLVLDGHKSHDNLEFYRKCVESNVVLLLLPPHTSHILQPLDVGCFKSVQQFYSAELQRRASFGLVRIDSHEVVEIYAQLRPKALSSSNIQGGFRGSGLWPINPTAISFRFAKLKKALGNDAVKELQTDLAAAREDELVAQLLNVDEQLTVHETPIEQAPDVETALNPQTTPLDSLQRAISLPPTQAKRTSHTLMEEIAAERDPDRRLHLTKVAERAFTVNETRKTMYLHTSRAFFEANIDSKKAAKRKLQGHFGSGRVVNEEALKEKEQRQKKKDEYNRLHREHIDIKEKLAGVRKAFKEKTYKGDSKIQKLKIQSLVIELNSFRLHHPEFTPKTKRRQGQDGEISLFDDLDDEDTPKTPVQDSPTEPRAKKVRTVATTPSSSTPRASTAARSFTPLQPLPNDRRQPQLGHSSSLSQQCVFPVPTNTPVTIDYASQFSSQWQCSPMMPPQVPPHSIYSQTVPSTPSWDCYEDENNWQFYPISYS